LNTSDGRRRIHTPLTQNACLVYQSFRSKSNTQNLEQRIPESIHPPFMQLSLNVHVEVQLAGTAKGKIA